MKATRCLPGLVTLTTLLLAGWTSAAADSSVAAPMRGHWEGDARIVVAWCRQTNLHVAIDIRQDGSVTGKVGDAAILNGRLAKNRGWIGRKLNIATDYIVTGALSGPVVAREGITRKSVFMPVNFTGHTFLGGVHTGGSKFGGKENMILSASSLTLKHSE